ncbi:hypothetical protein NC651_005962 [Populus alba x Populus x berolinensis]|nr:hypothetical protein NC651_005962 [Populus alba x Populus x berolinensis]
MALLMQVFGIASDPRPGLEGHISPDPVDAEGYMVLLVYENVSLTQEVSAIDGKMGFYCEDRETLPPSVPATRGASANQSILNSRASIFGGDVRTKTWLCIPKSWVRADHGWLCNENGSLGPFASLYGDNLENSSLC